ncbi:MAG: sulfatase-like hydrolase/transferase [Bacteroidota bacterium]
MNSYLQTVKNYLLGLLIILALYSLTRLVFLFCNFGYIGHAAVMNFIGGLRFDLAAIAIINLPFTLLVGFPVLPRFTNGKIFRMLFILLNFMGIAFNLIDCAYFSFTLKRTTSDLFTTQGIGKDILHLLPSFMADFWYLFVLSGLLLCLMVLLFRRITYTPFQTRNVRTIVLHSLVYLALLAGSVIAWRGGLQLRPINIVTAGSYGSGKQIALVLNTPFTIIRTATQKKTGKISYFDDNQLNAGFNLTRSFSKTSSQVKKNVVIIIMESFGEEYIGALSGQASYTPFLDSLIPFCYRPERGYANGRKSIEAMPAITASIPTLQETPFVSSSFAGNEINALPLLLKKSNYSSAFFHGGQNGTMGFDVYAKLAGYDQYFGMNEYPEPADYDGKWGIPDEPFLQYVARKMNTMPKPFIGTVFTLSSHHPFKVPAKYESSLPSGTLAIHKSVAYADLALRNFFTTLSTQPWFRETVFVITGDHTSLSDNAFYSNPAGVYAVPILFYLPGQQGTTWSGIGQHLDITPTVLDFLGYQGSLQFIGNTLRDSSWTRWNLNYTESGYQLIENNFLLRFTDNQAVGLYNISTDSLTTSNLVESNPEMRKKLEDKTKAIIQQYTNRQLANRLTRP